MIIAGNEYINLRDFVFRFKFIYIAQVHTSALQVNVWVSEWLCVFGVLGVNGKISKYSWKPNQCSTRIEHLHFGVFGSWSSFFFSIFVKITLRTLVCSVCVCETVYMLYRHMIWYQVASVERQYELIDTIYNIQTAHSTHTHTRIMCVHMIKIFFFFCVYKRARYALILCVDIIIYFPNRSDKLATLIIHYFYSFQTIIHTFIHLRWFGGLTHTHTHTQTTRKIICNI